MTEQVIPLIPHTSTPTPTGSYIYLDVTQVSTNPVSAPPKKILLKPPRLVVTTEPDHGFRATFELTGENLTLGRATDNNLCLALSIISRHHAVFNRLNSESQEPTYKIIQRQSINPL